MVRLRIFPGGSFCVRSVFTLSSVSNVSNVMDVGDEMHKICPISFFHGLGRCAERAHMGGDLSPRPFKQRFKVE